MPRTVTAREPQSGTLQRQAVEDDVHDLLDGGVGDGPTGDEQAGPQRTKEQVDHDVVVDSGWELSASHGPVEELVVGLPASTGGPMNQLSEVGVLSRAPQEILEHRSRPLDEELVGSPHQRDEIRSQATGVDWRDP